MGHSREKCRGLYAPRRDSASSVLLRANASNRADAPSELMAFPAQEGASQPIG